MKRTLKSKAASDPIEVECQRSSTNTGQRFTVRRDGHALEIEVDVVGDNRGRFRLHDRTVEYFVSRRERTISIWVGGRTYVFEQVDGARAAEARHTGLVQESLTAPMPGSILNVKAAAGDRFAAHQPLVIMESMKMEMTLSVPHAGVVREVRCAPGQMVDMGAVLLTLDPAESE